MLYILFLPTKIIFFLLLGLVFIYPIFLIPFLLILQSNLSYNFIFIFNRKFPRIFWFFISVYYKFFCQMNKQVFLFICCISSCILILSVPYKIQFLVATLTKNVAIFNTVFIYCLWLVFFLNIVFRCILNIALRMGKSVANLDLSEFNQLYMRRFVSSLWKTAETLQTHSSLPKNPIPTPKNEPVFTKTNMATGLFIAGTTGVVGYKTVENLAIQSDIQKKALFEQQLANDTRLWELGVVSSENMHSRYPYRWPDRNLPNPPRNQGISIPIDSNSKKEI